MAGTIITDKIQTENAFLTLNVGQTQVASINSGGIYGATGTKIIGSDGSISTANTLYLGANATSPLGGTTNPVLGMILSANNYIQSYIYNPSNTALSSADIACYPSNGSDANGWIDMGITSNAYSYSAYPITGRNEGYILMSAPGGSGTSGNLVFATDSTGSNNGIQFYTGGFSQAKANAKMNIDGNGVEILRASASNSTSGLTLTNTDNSGYGSALNWNLKLNSTAGIWGRVNVEAASSTASFMRFYTTVGSTLAERMRIDSAGDVIVNDTTSTSHKVSITAPSAYGALCLTNGATNGYYALRVDNPSTNHYAALFRENGTNVGTIITTSSTTAYNTSSDYRLKKNVAPMTGALATVAQLKPCTYKWKIDNSDGQGFIAHELQAVVPQAVSGAKDAVDANGNPDYQGVDTSFLVATLTAAIQEQQAIISDLKARIEVLEA
jgi:hypothetical protein